MSYNKEELIQLLTGLQTRLSKEVESYPQLAPVVNSLALAAKGVETGQMASRAAPALKPVSISYEGQYLLVKTPWGKEGRALADAFKAIVGRQSRKINPETNEPYFLTVFDKTKKAHRIPMSKKNEVLKAIAASGLPLEA